MNTEQKIKNSIVYNFEGAEIHESDLHNFNYIVWKAVDRLKHDDELSSEFDVTPEEVEEIYQPFIIEWLEENDMYDDSIWTLPNGNYE